MSTGKEEKKFSLCWNCYRNCCTVNRTNGVPSKCKDFVGKPKQSEKEGEKIEIVATEIDEYNGITIERISKKVGRADIGYINGCLSFDKRGLTKKEALELKRRINRV